MTGKHAAHWINRERLRTYSGGALIALVILAIRTGWSTWKRFGQPDGMDFMTFWTASRLWLDGTPLKAYSLEALGAAVKQLSPNLPAPAPFFYPPNFLLILRPLALVPCSVASLLFGFSTAAILVVLLRKILPMREAILPILAFPGLWLNLGQGQNGALTASLALGALLLMNKRPVLAGICVGLLSIKPHLGLLFPIALACAGMWTAFVSASVTVVIFTGVSIFVFGLAVIPAFLHGLNFARAAVEIGYLPWAQMSSVFASLREAHVPVSIAYAGQACSALAAAVAVGWVWRRSGDTAMRATVLIAGTFLVSPYAYEYDAVWLAGAIALYVAKGLRDGWMRWEREILCVAWFSPPLVMLAGNFVNSIVGPIVFAALVGLAVRRVRRENSGAQ